MTSVDSPRLIVVPVDYSEHAEMAYAWYLANIKKTGDFLHVIHIHEPLIPSYVGWTYHEVGIQIEMEKKRVFRLLKKYEHKLGHDKIEGITYHEVNHNPGEAIVAYAKENKADMILMASRGHGKVRQTILGSISAYVLHHAPMPVLIIPKPHHHHHSFGCHDNKEVKVGSNGALYDKLPESTEEETKM